MGVMGDQLGMIKVLARALLEEVESLGEYQVPLVEPGGEGWTDFYEMVRNYEIRLIRRALLRTHGHQAQAARLLRLNPTTLHNKMKLYKLGADGRATPRGGGALIPSCTRPCARSESVP